MAKKLKDQKKKNSPLNTVAVGMGQTDVIQKRGEAASQFVQAYKGQRIDSQGGEIPHAGRSLRQISQYKVNPKYVQQNLKQQSGFSAELLEEANRNREAILNGSTARTRTTDGIGRTNDTQYDLVTLDESGSIIDASQMKFLGIDQKGRYSVIEKLAKDRSWDRYDKPIDIPKDQYEGACQYADTQAQKLLEQAKNLRQRGCVDKALEKERLAERYQQAQKRIRPSHITEAEALAARKNPQHYVAKQVISDVHQAGVQAAQGAILVGGAVSLVQNISGVYSGDISAKDAIENVAVTTAKTGLTAYGIGSTGAALKAAMHTSKSAIIRKLGTTNLPALAVTSALEIASVVKAYVVGDISEEQALERLGKNGTGTLAAGYGAAVGTLLMPGIGTIVGSMVGYMVSSSIYDSCMQIIHSADIAKENYLRAKDLCEAARVAMRQQRSAFEAQVEQLLAHRQIVIDQSLRTIMDTMESSDTTNFTQALSNLAAEFGRELPFQSDEEFDQFMSDTSTAFAF